MAIQADQEEENSIEILGHWDADENEKRLITDQAVIDKREHDAEALTGDFVPDFIRNCHVLGVTPHPHLTGECDSVGQCKAKETEDEEPQSTIKVMGWKLDQGCLAALQLTIPSCGSLTTINFWHANLTAQGIRDLAAMLNDTTIQRLHLDFNPLTEKTETQEETKAEGDSADTPAEGRGTVEPLGSPFADLISHSSPLQLLSLRGNGIDDVVACEIFAKLKDNKNLLGVGLQSNVIGDASMSELTNALMVNKALASLSLAQNLITDTGITSLITTFQSPLVDKDDVKKLKALGIACSGTKGKNFRDPNMTLRSLNIGHNKIGDIGCNEFVSLWAVEEPAAPVADKKGSKKGGKEPGGKECKLERIDFTNNPFTTKMHETLASDSDECTRFVVQALPAKERGEEEGEGDANEGDEAEAEES